MKTTVTNEFIESGKSAAGGWNRKQIETLGLDWPLASGWKNQIIGTVIESTAAALFLSLKGATLKPRKGEKPGELTKQPGRMVIENPDSPVEIAAMFKKLEQHHGKAFWAAIQEYR